MMRAHLNSPCQSSVPMSRFSVCYPHLFITAANRPSSRFLEKEITRLAQAQLWLQLSAQLHRSSNSDPSSSSSATPDPTAPSSSQRERAQRARATLSAQTPARKSAPESAQSPAQCPAQLQQRERATASEHARHTLSLFLRGRSSSGAL